MGLATIDPHSHKVQTKLYKVPTFGVNISLLILTFLNRCISVKTSLINIKLGRFVNLGVLFLTMGMASCLSHNLQTRT